MEFPKVQVKSYNTLEKWMRFLKKTSKEEILSMDEKTISKAFEELEYLSHDPANRAKYEARRKYLLDYNTSMLTAKEEGIEIGKK